jgi:hypothetical protein
MKLPKNKATLTFEQLEYIQALEKLKNSYYVLSPEKIEEIKKIARGL